MFFAVNGFGANLGNRYVKTKKDRSLKKADRLKKQARSHLIRS